MSRHIQVVATADALAAAVAQQLATRVTAIQLAGRTPTVVLTGGSIAIQLYEQLPEATEWSDVDYYWGDERWVPTGHPDRNDRQAHEAFLDRLGVPASRIHAMPADDGVLTPAEGAARYAESLPTKPFDIVLLGMGPDAHVASLFPGRPELAVVDRPVVEVFNSPKPPPTRLTLTYPALNNAREVWLVVSGDAKAEAVKAGVSGSADAPAAGAHGLNDTQWWLDTAAASLLD